MRSNCTSASLSLPVGGSRGGVAEHRNRLGLRLVHLDILLHGVDELLLQVVRSDGLVRDLTQSHDRVLVAVAVDREGRARRDEAGPVAGQQHELKPVVDLVDAVFDGHASHAGLLLQVQGISEEGPDTPVISRKQEDASCGRGLTPSRRSRVRAHGGGNPGWVVFPKVKPERIDLENLEFRSEKSRSRPGRCHEAAELTEASGQPADAAGVAAPYLITGQCEAERSPP